MDTLPSIAFSYLRTTPSCDLFAISEVIFNSLVIYDSQPSSVASPSQMTH